MRTRTAAAALALAGAVAAGIPATAAGAPATSASDTTLRVYSPRGVHTLICTDPNAPTGTHPYPNEACKEIDNALGDIAAIPPRVIACQPYWDPVLIGVTGRWQGRELLFSNFQSNPGCAQVSPGHVFWY